MESIAGSWSIHCSSSIHISMNQPEAVCDGNVVRVMSRVFAISKSFKDGATAQKKIQPLAQLLISEQRPGDYNQAVMELGATVCLRSNPLCSHCPIHKNCKAGKTGNWQNYPALNAKTKKIRKFAGSGWRRIKNYSFEPLPRIDLWNFRTSFGTSLFFGRFSDYIHHYSNPQTHYWKCQLHRGNL